MATANPFKFEEDTTLETGFETDSIISSPQSPHDFNCGACLCLVRDPVTMGCRHIMCKRCLVKWAHDTCPICRHQFTSHRDLSRQSPQYMDYMAHHVRCKMGGLECGFEGNPRQVHEHQDSGDCPNNPYICLVCNKRIIASTSAAHEQYHKWEAGTIFNQLFSFFYPLFK